MCVVVVCLLEEIPQTGFLECYSKRYVVCVLVLVVALVTQGAGFSPVVFLFFPL